MVKKILKMQQVVALALALALSLATPVATYAKDGKKHFKEGLKYEENRQWDKAAEKFALAVAEKPSSIEFQLHLQRALVQAGLMLVERGDSLAEEKDYKAAYQAYRQAYAFDPTNELAFIKMRRMLEAQGLPLEGLPRHGDPAGPKLKPQNGSATQRASWTIKPTGVAERNLKVQLPGIPARKFPKTDVIVRSDNLLSVIEQIAQSMKLNVVFDQQVTNLLRNTKLAIELRDVTYPKALEIILKTNNLMYAQIDSRTIVVVQDNPQVRQRYEQFAVRTFYVKNADINEVRTAIQTSLPQSKGLVPIKQLNAIIVRDTPSNLELVESLIDTLDKSKAEVLVDVNIYEVSRSDMLHLGNQFNPEGDAAKGVPGFNFLGGIGRPDVLGKGPRTLTGPLGFAIGLPTSAISFFHDKGKAKLLASTQIHVLDGEANAIRIGQRVPIQTAAYPTGITAVATGTGKNPTNPVESALNPFLGGAGFFPQIQYENVGLNIDITPSVFEDEVFMKMKIESSSVDSSTSTLTPTFSQRTMTSAARIKDGQTTLIAGVSQNTESRNVKGLPIIGLIPILGRFFATPNTTNRQSDVVITVTPHILRRADIREEDHLAKLSGTGADASNPLSIEQILYFADIEEAQQNQVAANGAPKTNGNPATGQPAQPENKTVVTNYSSPQPATPPKQEAPAPGVVVFAPPTAPPTVSPAAPAPKVERKVVARPGVQPAVLDDDDDDDDDDDEAMRARQRGQTGPVMVSVRNASSVATKGQQFYVAIIVNGNAEISYSNVSLAYDPNILEVKAVRDGGLMRNAELQFHAEGGVLTAQLERPAEAGGVPARGQLLLLVFDVKNQGTSPLTLNEQQTFFRSPNGQPVQVRLQSSQVEVR